MMSYEHRTDFYCPIHIQKENQFEVISRRSQPIIANLVQLETLYRCLLQNSGL
jgi:hypothetical protein